MTMKSLIFEGFCDEKGDFVSMGILEKVLFTFINMTIKSYLQA